MEAYLDEHIKETLKPWEFPQIITISGDTVRYFKGKRSEARLLEFLQEGKHVAIETTLPPRITNMGLQIRYFVNKLPLLEMELDRIIFRPFGLD